MTTTQTPHFHAPSPTDPADARSRRPIAVAPPQVTARETTPARGDIWFVSSRSGEPDLGSHRSVGREIWSNKLAVVLSNDAMNTRSGIVQVVYLTMSENKRPNRLHIQVDMPAASQTHVAVALCEQVHSVDQSRLTSLHGAVAPEQLKNIEGAVSWSLGMAHRQPKS